MWVCTNFGFFSATQRTDKKPALLFAEGDNRTLQIRARHTSHLEALRTIMGDQLGPTIELKNRDYQARAYATPEAWGRALAEMSMGIDYGNFKNSVKNNDLHDAYMKVWNALAAVYGTGYTHGGWTDYRSTGTSKYGSKPKVSHLFEEHVTKGKHWCNVKVDGRYCEALTHEHPKTVTAQSASKSKSVRAANGRFAKSSEVVEGTSWQTGKDAYRQPALTATATTSYSWDHNDTLIEESDSEADKDPGFLSLAKAASKVGCPTKQLRDWMSSQNEWKDYRDGHAWFIPADTIDDLEFKFWAETGR